ncbi:MAG TPA: ABC transporter permease, partial [Pseudomonas sp.]|nr:ABC transporter permease [Pseudomonas sp.]
MSSTRRLLHRLGHAALTLFGVITLVFFLQRLAGDPVLLLVPENASLADIQMLRHSLGFDRPLSVQYLEFLVRAAHLDLGTSLVQQVPVSEIVA